MDRRKFLQNAAAGAVALNSLPAMAMEASKTGARSQANGRGLGVVPASKVSTEGHTLHSTFSRNGEQWKVYEDLRTRDGVITFVSSSGKARVLPKTAEAVFPEDGPQYLGLELKDIGMAARDLLADKLLADGDPVEAEVRRAAPPMDSEHRQRGRGYRPSWNTFVGTRECSDTMPVYPSGNTRTYHPVQYIGELTNERSEKRHEGLVGGWMPAVRKVLPGDNGSYYEMIVFGDVLAKDRFIVQTWHRTAKIENGRITKVEFGYSYPAYDGGHASPSAEEFYRGLLEFAEYWERLNHETVPITLPDPSWTNFVNYAFMKEQMVRPDGYYPKYGAVDRDYYGPEYDGFQDTFTMSFYANLECGRFEQTREVVDNYFAHFVDDKGMVNMRGPETGQFGLTLWLIARYYNYTGDKALLLKHRKKIEATVALLEHLHDVSLKLPESDRGYGLISGWCESDSCLMPDPSLWWKPYFSNSAFTVRGWREIAGTWRKLGLGGGSAWTRRADQLEKQLLKSIDANTRRDMNPPYVALLPGSKLTFMEAYQTGRNEQGWAHRCYTELVHPGVLPDETANAVIDTMRAYGVTTIGVVANVERPNPRGRAILGFISYGYAHELMRLGRIEEYILFMYAHRYHDHSRGSWTAGEVSGITGGGALFCIPAQQTIPLLVRWALVWEHPDEDKLCFGRALPREWIATGKPIAIEGAPTRWGRVHYHLAPRGGDELVATITMPERGELPKELQVSFRVPKGKTISSLTSNGETVSPGGKDKDTAVINPGGKRKFEVVARFA